MNGSFQSMYSAVSGNRDEKESSEKRKRASFKEFPILSFSVMPSIWRLYAKWVSVMNGIQFILPPKVVIYTPTLYRHNATRNGCI